MTLDPKVDASRRQSSPLAGHSVVLALAGLILGGTLVKAHVDRNAAIDDFRAAAEVETGKVAEGLSVTLRQIYRGIRTIAVLPGVSGIDPHGANLNKDSGASIDANCQNLITNAAVSEVYIVPNQMKPEEVDLGTGSLWVPARM